MSRTSGYRHRLDRFGFSRRFFPHGYSHLGYGVLIITEAGGAVMHTDGSEFNLMGRQIVAAASEELAKEIVGQIMIYKVDPEFNEHCPM